MVKEIELSKGAVTLVDDEDYELLSQWKWYYNYGYAVRMIRENGKRKMIRMHRVVLPPPDGMEIDHINNGYSE